MKRPTSHARDFRPLAVIAGALLLAGGCTSRDDDLERFIAATRKEPGGRVQPLPEVKPYESFIYADKSARSPFMPGSSASLANVPNVRPDSRRNREFLEQYSLDTLKMVGTIKLSGRVYGLVQTKDGLVHRVAQGNYLGQSEGKITDIGPSRISLVEIVPDGLGGYMERPAALALNE